MLLLPRFQIPNLPLTLDSFLRWYLELMTTQHGVSTFIRGRETRLVRVLILTMTPSVGFINICNSFSTTLKRDLVNIAKAERNGIICSWRKIHIVFCVKVHVIGTTEKKTQSGFPLMYFSLNSSSDWALPSLEEKEALYQQFMYLPKLKGSSRKHRASAQGICVFTYVPCCPPIHIDGSLQCSYIDNVLQWAPCSTVASGIIWKMKGPLQGEWLCK